MKDEKIIGIVGGMGPYAGLELARKILDQTKAPKDQDHLSIALISVPRQIEDRTSFLLGETSVNPADAIYKVICDLKKIGADIIGIACNTTFAPRIYDEIVKCLERDESDIKIVNIVEEAVDFIQNNHPRVKNVGVLCTTGAYKANTYKTALLKRGYNVILPDEAVQHNIVQKAIYDPESGIKAKSNPVTPKAKKWLLEAIVCLQEQNAEAVILGCTEMCLAVSRKRLGKTVIIDPTTTLARALVREVNMDKLKAGI